MLVRGGSDYVARQCWEKKSIHGPNFIDIVIAQYDIEVVITIDEPALEAPWRLPRGRKAAQTPAMAQYGPAE